MIIGPVNPSGVSGDGSVTGKEGGGLEATLPGPTQGVSLMVSSSTTVQLSSLGGPEGVVEAVERTAGPGRVVGSVGEV